MLQLIGWFVFGSLLVVKGAVINHYASSAKDFGRALAGDHFQPETSTATFYILKVGEKIIVWEYSGRENNNCQLFLEFTFDISRVRISLVMLPGQTQLCG